VAGLAVKSSRRVIKATEVNWGAAITFKAPVLPPPPVAPREALPSDFDEVDELDAPEPIEPVRAVFAPLRLEPDLPASAPGPDLGELSEKLLAEAEAEKARRLEAVEAEARQLEQAARAKAAEIEQLARAQAAEFEQLANEQAEEVVRVAKEQAAEVTRQARREGFEAAEADAGQLLLAAQGVLDEVRAWRSSMFAQSERAVLDLVAHIAKVIFGEGVALPREALEAAFGRALTEARPLGNLRVRVHPSDAAVLSPTWAQQAAPTGQRLELVPDENIRRGGCLVEGESGMVDARVETQQQLALGTLTPSAKTTQED
jgi:flagellar assembly protein FliH